MKAAMARLVGKALVTFARVLTGVRAFRSTDAASSSQTVYFANHASHADFVLIWATLPEQQRRRTRPVAAADYWTGSGLRTFVGARVFHALLIERTPRADGPDPIRQMADALRGGDSLIMFPEGTRNMGDEALLPFKSGLYRLALACPEVCLVPVWIDNLKRVALACPEVCLVPVWIDNLKRVLPKGATVPLPLACTVHYGAPIALAEGDDKASFLARARQSLLALRPRQNEDHP